MTACIPFPILACLAVAAAVSVPSVAGAQCRQVDDLQASDGVGSDYYGCSLSARGNLVVVGALYDTEAAKYYMGSAYVFRKNANGWTEEQKLLASDGAAYDYFGSSVATDGTRVVVGAPAHAAGGSGRGAAYVYAFNGSTWIEEAKLTASDLADYDQFGNAVSISGNLIAVGAYTEDNLGYDQGSVYVFRRSNLFGWVEERKITPSDPANYDNFGKSVCIEGTRLLVGCPLKDIGVKYDAGKVYVYTNTSGTNWPETQTFTTQVPNSYDNFGEALTQRGTLAVIGAPLTDAQGTDSGAAFVFRHNGTAFVQEAMLVPAAVTFSQYVGRAVATDGTNVALGAAGFDTPASDAGSAWSFVKRNGVWGEEQRLQNANTGVSQGLGWSVALDGKRLLAGGIYAPGKSAGTGNVFAFSVYEFVLDASASAVNPGDPLSFSMYPGKPGSLAAFCVANINGIPNFMPLIFTPFNSTCQFNLSTNTPSGLSGLNVGFMGLRIDSFGKVSLTAIEQVQFN